MNMVKNRYYSVLRKKSVVESLSKRLKEIEEGNGMKIEDIDQDHPIF
eukprot:CAMPEP_0114577078 /NCGR_PEP_ID=MMETSP0125-20121206/1778_1 /TAXON_ID=485358 ORGANISM="Aristerostoma sp., Strain ATCC 50986" /NCGR_SAMPLE_ID=MMETSP0125 /ASSEMBLY_ACC=CAM_ASM_000245 /LENGTH=46 /DNA_ID= /DNA_START= /DNA_END= /DNA_ORIENTATION=